MYPKQVICHFSTKKPFLQDFLFELVLLVVVVGEIVEIVIQDWDLPLVIFVVLVDFLIHLN